MYKTTGALVLREADYRDSGKILTVLTESDGKLTVSARGARRRGSRIAAASQLLAYSEMTLFGSRGRWTLNEAETRELFPELRQDIRRFALAGYIAELLDALSDEDAPSPELLSLGLNSLYALSRLGREPEEVKAVFELRAMCLSGYRPETEGCFVCGREAPEPPVFDLTGGLRCKRCPGGRSVALTPELLDALRRVVYAEPKRIFAYRLPGALLPALSALTGAYLSEQLEREFRTLAFYRQFGGQAAPVGKPSD